jgi:LPXTG-motif cell wall-anchored protein
MGLVDKMLSPIRPSELRRMEEKMNLFTKNVAALAVAGMFMFVAPNVRADEWNKRTVVTIDQPVQLPTTVLQAGTYVFKLLDSPSDRHIVQIFDKDDKKLITTILAIPNWRLQPRGKTIFAFWETPAGQPQAVRAWFYPGDNFGQEFAYPKNMSLQIAASNKASVPMTSAQSAEEMKTSTVVAVNETGQENELAADTYRKSDDQQVAAAPAPAPEPEPVLTAQAEPAPVVAPQPQEAPVPAQLPQTGSQMPLVGLAGLLSLGLFFALARVQGAR